jgi:uncharacterized protein with GYD domain
VPYYMVQLSYTPQAVGNMVQTPQNRIEAVRPAFEELGVTIRDAYLAFGEYDVVLLVAPGNVQAAAIAMAVTAGGGVSKYRTTSLITWEEGVEAMQAAGGSGYQPPSS